MKDERTRSAFALATALAVAAAIAGCDLNNAGVPVPPARLNFPIAIALVHPGVPEPVDGADPVPPTHLLVANSNFDLRFASGTLQSFSIARIDEAIAGCPRLASDAGMDVSDAGPSAATRPCEISDDEVATLIDDEVQVGSHMDGIAVSTAHDRVYLAVRSGTGRLTWVTLTDAGQLSCDADATDGTFESCDAAHRRADATAAAARGLTLPSDPVAIVRRPLEDVTPGQTGDYLVMAHRSGAVSLFLDDHASVEAPPRYVHTLTGVPNDIVSIEADHTGLVWLTSAAGAAARATRDLVAVEVIPTTVAGAPTASLAIARRATLRGVDDGQDTRDIAIDPHRGRTDARLWVLSRRPESIVTVDFSLEPFAAGEAPLGPIHSVGFGPSRLERFEIDGSPLLLATCYDAHSVFVVDPETGPVATVAGFDGPFEVAIDPTTLRAYVVDFRLSVIWVVDLSPLAHGGSPVAMARLGSGHAPSVFR